MPTGGRRRTSRRCRPRRRGGDTRAGDIARPRPPGAARGSTASHPRGMPGRPSPPVVGRPLASTRWLATVGAVARGASAPVSRPLDGQVIPVYCVALDLLDPAQPRHSRRHASLYRATVAITIQSAGDRLVHAHQDWVDCPSTIGAERSIAAAGTAQSTTSREVDGQRADAGLSCSDHVVVRASALGRVRRQERRPHQAPFVPEDPADAAAARRPRPVSRGWPSARAARRSPSSRACSA